MIYYFTHSWKQIIFDLTISYIVGIGAAFELKQTFLSFSSKQEPDLHQKIIKEIPKAAANLVEDGLVLYDLLLARVLLSLELL